MIQLFIAILLFTFLAIGGLVADLGLVRVTQRTMNNATDSAAMEGVRYQDALDDANRRAAVRDMVHAHFDDDFRVTASDPYQYGAGALVTLSGGQGSMLANQQVNVDPAVVYEPQPQLNLPNVQHGDMVSGYFNLVDLAHLEDTGYNRSDFSFTQTDPDLTPEAFLVRMRRTLNEQGLDAQPGISSSGPTVPYLFGRGSMMANGMRGRGVTVRSTSIAAGRHATSAGIARLDLGFVGTAPFGLEHDYWQSLPTNTDITLDFSGQSSDGTNPPGGPPLPNPNPTQGGPPIIPPGQMVGSTGEPLGVFFDRWGLARTSWSIGDPVPPDLNPDRAAILQQLGDPLSDEFTPTIFFVPIYEGDVGLFYDGRPGNSNPPFLPPVNNVPKDDMDPRVVGFGAVLLIDATIDNGSGNNGNNGNGNGNNGNGNGNNGNGNGNGNNGNGNGNGNNGNNGNGNNGNGNNGNTGTTNENLRLTIRKLPSFVWPENVSAVETPGLAGLPPWMARLITELNRGIDEPIRAAALVR